MTGIAPAGYFEEWYADRTWAHYRPMLAKIIELADPGPLLDVGAGAGLFVEAADRWGIPCTGLEGSREGIRTALDRRPGMDIREHRIEEPFPLPDGHFAAALLNQVVEHLSLEDAHRALAETLRVLQPGGLVLVYSPSRFNRAEAEADPTHRHLFAPKELVSVLLEVGFVDIESLDWPLPLLGGTRFGSSVMRVLFKVAPLQPLSATANCAARKRDG